MRNRPHVRGRALPALISGAFLCCFAAGCGGSSSGEADSSATESANVEGMPSGLSGTLTYYDTAGGLVTESMQTLMGNFQQGTGVKVVSDFNSANEKFFAAAQSGAVPWDLVLFSSVGGFLKAKEEGYLKELDTSIVPVDKLDPSAVDPYGVLTQSYGSVLAWNTEEFPTSGPQPASLADFFDTTKFPGRRCMFQYPEFGGTLEVPLLADGVAPADLYPLDVPRALDKLDTIKDDIVWYTTGAESTQKLSNGTCSIGIVWSGRIFDAVVNQHLPFDMTWEGAVISNAVWAVPNKAADPKRGEAFLSWFIQDHAGQEALVNGTAYPTEIKELPLSSYSADIQPYLPLGDNAAAAIKEDGDYYAENLDDVVEQFNAWVGQ